MEIPVGLLLMKILLTTTSSARSARSLQIFEKESASNVSTNRVTILIYGIPYLPLQQSLPYTSAGFDVATRHINNLYRNMSFRAVYAENSAIRVCEDTVAHFDIVSQYYYRRRDPGETTVLMYPGCHSSPVLAQLGQEWDLLVVSTGTTYSNLRDRTIYPTTIALGPAQYEIFGITIRLVLERYRWTTVALIYDVSGRPLFNSIVYYRIQYYLQIYMPHVRFIPFQVNATEREQIAFSTILEQATKSTRIIFTALPYTVTRMFVIQSSRAGWKTGQLVWIVVDPVIGVKSSDIWKQNDQDDWARADWLFYLGEQKVGDDLQWLLRKRLPESRWKNHYARIMTAPSYYDIEALQGFQTVFKLQNCIRRPDTEDVVNLSEEIKQKSLAVYNVTYLPNEKINEFVHTAFAAVFWLGQVLHGISLKERHSGRVLANRFLNRTFSTPFTGDLYVDEQGERQNQICFMAFNMTSRSFEVVMRYFQGISGKLLPVDGARIYWATPDGRPPSDRPACAGSPNAQAPLCSRNSSSENFIIILATALVLSVLALPVLIIAYSRLRRRDGRADSNWWHLLLDDSPTLCLTALLRNI